MKKLLCLSVFLALGICVSHCASNANFSKGFIKHFRNCEPYEESLTSEFEGHSFSVKKNIIGWQNGQCLYQESIYSSSGNYSLNCSFNELTTKELYEAMSVKSKEETQNIELFESRIDKKTGEIKYYVSGAREIKGDRAYITWARFLNNPYFCVPKKF